MKWGFTLIDRDGLRTGIKEPLGWESFSIKIKRHPKRHGTFMEVQGNQFDFIDKAMELLRIEYEIYGTDGYYELEIRNRCAGSWMIFYVGTIDFKTYVYTCGLPCKVTAEVQKVGPLVDFLNRFDQPVNVDSTFCFDEVTDIQLGTKNKNILLPSKAFLLKADASNSGVRSFDLEADPAYVFPGTSPFPPDAGQLSGAIALPLNVITDSSLQIFAPAPTAVFYPSPAATPAVISNDPASTIKCTAGTFTLDVRAKGRFKYTSSGASGTSGLSLAFLLFVDDVFTLYADIDTMIQNTDIIGTTFPVVDHVNSGDIDAVTEFDIAFAGDVEVPQGSKIYCFLALGYLKFTDFTDTVEIEFDPQTHFHAEIISTCVATEAKLRMINETVDTVIESITNRRLKLYSEYYGRTDSLPFSFEANGCGALRAVTTGLDIRRVLMKDGNDPSLFLSMQDCFDALCAIDNIGIGTDTQQGFDVIRMEHWKFFYQDEVIHRCAGVDQIKTSSRTDMIYSIFKTGFAKWEAESFAGLDEFLTRREYRTQLTGVQNTLEQICKWIASGYAIETTRRFGINDKDWRYDNETFLLCLSTEFHISGIFIEPNQLWLPKNTFFDEDSVGKSITIQGTVFNDGTYTIDAFTISIFDLVVLTLSAGVTSETVDLITITDNDADPAAPKYAVELGNITCAAFVVDPATLYNYRISPAHMAMRWFDTIMTAFRKRIDDYKLIFSKGDGNFVARGSMVSTVCKPENGLLRENESITPHRFADPEVDATPIFTADKKEFDFGLSAEAFKKIMASPYGLIGYGSGCERGAGWIDELQYFPEAGKAKWNLIPKMDVTLTTIAEICCNEIAFVEPVVPDLLVEEDLFVQVTIFGDPPFTILDQNVPAWMIVDLTGNILTLTGRPSGPDTGADVVVFINIGGCNESQQAIDQTITVGIP